MKKLVTLLLTLAMLLTMMTALAEDVPTEQELGSITVNGVGESTILRIYRLLDLESYDHASGAYSYKVNADWAAFFATETAKAYFTIDDSGYATWIANDSDVAAFAKLALAYAKDNGIQPVKSSDVEGDAVFTPATDGQVSNYKFSGLKLGYYLVDSSVGALCGLTTTNPNASVNAKNGQPTIDKQVQEDATGLYGDENSADIGQIVNFMTIINVHAGAENYVLHDKMSVGLTFDKVIKVERVTTIDGQTTTTEVDPSNYVVTAAAEEAPIADGCTFEVAFTKDFCDTLQNNERLIVHYCAMLNRNAVVGKEGNTNESWLEYGEDNNTTHDQTKTHTYGFDLVKTDSQNALIDGAEFKIYDAATGGNEVAVVLMDDGVTYRRARADETGVSIVVKDGKVRVVGFDNGTYYLEETVAPAGYNKLNGRVAFTISDGNLDAVFNDGVFSTGSGVQVVNKTGTMLPETGGVGTTLFYVFGGLMVVGAVVLMVTRKRMNSWA